MKLIETIHVTWVGAADEEPPVVADEEELMLNDDLGVPMWIS